MQLHIAVETNPPKSGSKIGPRLLQLLIQIGVCWITAALIPLIVKFLLVFSLRSFFAALFGILVDLSLISRLSKRSPDHRLLGFDVPLTLRQGIPVGLGVALGSMVVRVSLQS